MSLFRRTLLVLSEAQKVATPKVAFNVSRTASKKLPVYIDYVPPKRAPITIVRKFTGDQAELRVQLQRLVGPHVRVVEHTGRITVAGNYASKIRNWLEGLGF